jgi:hypothetical protein
LIKCIPSTLTLFLWFSFVSIILLSPLISNVYIPSMGDIFNHLATISQARLGLLEGQFPLRVAPSELAGFHYPLFQFYSPTSYTVAGLIYEWLTPTNPFMAYKITLWGCLVGGGFFMYRLANWLIQDRLAAFFAATVYLTTPYFIIAINHMGSFNEVIALCFQPLIIYYTLRCYYDPISLKRTLQTALLWYLLATIHLITFISLSCFMGLFIFFLTAQRVKPSKNILNIMISYIFGCLLATWFLAPIQFLAKYLVISNSFNYLQWQPLSDLFSLLPHFTSETIAALSTHPSVGWPILFGMGMCVYIMFFEPGTKKSSVIKSLLLLFFIALFLVWSPFNIWKNMPDFLRVVQYNWRLLSQVIWIGALLFAWTIHWLLDSKIKRSYLFITTSLLMLTTLAWLPITEMRYVLRDNTQQSSLNFGADSYLIDAKKNPRWVNYTDHSNPKSPPASDTSFVFPLKEMIPHCERIKDSMRCILIVPTTTKLLELPIFYYPGLLNITLNGHAVPYLSIAYDYYLIAGIIPEAGQLNVIEFTFRGSLLANYISYMAWMLWLILLTYLILRHLRSALTSR